MYVEREKVKGYNGEGYMGKACFFDLMVNCIGMFCASCSSKAIAGAMSMPSSQCKGMPVAREEARATHQQGPTYPTIIVWRTTWFPRFGQWDSLIHHKLGYIPRTSPTDSPL